MSYCRWSECDVYAYDSCEGGVRFYVADGRKDLDRLCNTYNEAYQYMQTLRDQHGLDVPDHAIDELKSDAIEEAKQIGGPHGVVSDLLADNAKLRELATGLYKCWVNEGCEGCPMQDDDGWCVRDIRLRELGVEDTE